jgi:hypothetical protein
MSKQKFFNPKTHIGWHKSQSTETRRRNALNGTDKNLSLHSRYIQAGRKLIALSNVTTDPVTKLKARSDADYFFAQGRKYPAKKVKEKISAKIPGEWNGLSFIKESDAKKIGKQVSFIHKNELIGIVDTGSIYTLKPFSTNEKNCVVYFNGKELNLK